MEVELNIYVASSWRNQLQPEVVRVLRDCGHEVYDFRHPAEGNDGFHWSQVDPDWNFNVRGLVEGDRYRRMLEHPISAKGYKFDITALRICDAVVYVLPCGRSASWEFGYAMGQGKKAYVVWFEPHEPELMFMGATILTCWSELIETFGTEGQK